MKILLSKNGKFSTQPHITIEAEYGELTIKGSQMTLAHHGANKDNLAPCLNKVTINDLRLSYDNLVIGVSHIDADTLLGINSVYDFFTEEIKMHAQYHYTVRTTKFTVSDDFCKLVEFVDLSGPHVITKSEYYTMEAHQQLASYWSWSQANRCPRPIDVDCIDVTCYALEALAKLVVTFDMDEGRKFIQAENELEEKSFVQLLECITPNSDHDKDTLDIIVRKDDNFVNHLYLHDAEVNACVIGYNTKTKSITLSRSDDTISIDCCKVMQLAFGEKAGGHQGIAGTPRDMEFTEQDIDKIIQVIENEGVIDDIK